MVSIKQEGITQCVLYATFCVRAGSREWRLLFPRRAAEGACRGDHRRNYK